MSRNQKPTRNARRWAAGMFLALALIGVCFVVQQGTRKRQRGAILSRFAQIQYGMTRDEVEAILGLPIYSPSQLRDGSVEVPYLGPERRERRASSHESLLAFAGIIVTYREGRVVEKWYNRQWVAKPAEPWFP